MKQERGHVSEMVGNFAVVKGDQRRLHRESAVEQSLEESEGGRLVGIWGKNSPDKGKA